ncbi:hypothetical protein OFY17_10555 [Marinomonas sp. C2222]|uniref:ABC transporter substrate-binding protein n=1 Tax=Marinomonas sargassi TaxID=2984494 RepID=A0ABT2YTU6_9GAMM|nr:hypothetical protein [Marinomonas sargassi]MCV2403321.1 hypothetical protein [Marinomonas sargassi]
MKRIFTLLICLFWSVSASSSVYVVHDIEEGSARSLVFQLSELLPSKTQLIPIRNIFLKPNLDHVKHDDMIVAIGVDSFSEICEYATQGNVIAAFIGKEEYLKVKQTCSIPSSAIFSGAPLEIRLSLLQSIWFDKKPMAVLYSDNLFINKEEMLQYAYNYGFRFRFYKVESDRLSATKVVREAIAESDLIISLMDSQLYNNRTSQKIRKILFQNNKVIIGASFPTTHSGALFAIFSNSDAKLNTLASYVESWVEGSNLLPPSYPNELRVNFNSFLVRAHGLVLPSSAYLKSAFGLCSEAHC